MRIPAVSRPPKPIKLNFGKNKSKIPKKDNFRVIERSKRRKKNHPSLNIKCKYGKIFN